MFKNMMLYNEAGERNWWTNVSNIMKQYNIPTNLETLKGLSKNQFKKMVSKSVTNVVLGQLVQDYHALKKCQNISYSSLEMQGYLKELYPSQARTLFMVRSSTLDIKTHRSHIYKDLICRGCGKEIETLSHIVNCNGLLAGLNVSSNCSNLSYLSYCLTCLT